MSFSERGFQWLAKMFFAAVVTLASMYLLLPNVVVANDRIVRSPIFGWIPAVVRWYPAMFLVAVIFIVVGMVRRRGKSAQVWMFAAVQLALAASLQVFSVLAHAVPGPASLAWSFLILTSLIWVAVIDLRSATQVSAGSSADAQGLSVRGAIVAAALVVVGYFLLGPAREVVGGNSVHRWDMLAMLPLSFMGHIALFLLFYIIAVIAWKIAAWIWQPEMRSFGALYLAIGIFGFILFRQIVLPSVLYTGWQADLYALVLPATLSLYFAAATLALRQQNVAESSGRINQWHRAVIYFVAIAAFAYSFSHAVPALDWNFLFQKLGVFCVWMAVFYVCQRLCNPESNSILYILLALVLGMAGMRAFTSITQSWSVGNFAATTYMNEATAEYLKRDTSFHALRDLARGSRINSSNERFYRYLADNSNISSLSAGFAPEVNLVERLERTRQPRPNIFLFVVDSLRPDYLSPYNKAVSFTPAIDAFAKESVVIRNAFTRYGGTVLSEPAIWTGTMQFHQQFLQTFAPINSLKKLLQADGYESWVSVDLVLQYVMDPEFHLKRLNENVQDWDLVDICDTMSEVQSGMDSRDTKTPLFVFVQGMNTHQLSIQRRQKTPPPPFSGFEPRTAYEVQKVDHCFGKFIEYLKAKGIYENSIVILTSDHGDEFFEHGNFGHVGSIYPEVLRVPLLFHLPTADKGLVVDQRAASFTTDITPSLYYLLGHGPLKKNIIFGRTLFARSEEELRAAESPHYLVASSYAPIYGILDQWGQSLYIADALNNENYFFDLAHDPQGKENKITFATQVKNEALISQEIAAIANFYHFKRQTSASAAIAGVPSGNPNR